MALGGTGYGVTADIQARLDRAFTYHAPKGDQPNRYTALRAAAKDLATARLIAAAPDLFSIVRQFAEMYHKGDPVAYYQNAKLRDETLAALAKAASATHRGLA